MQEKKTWTRSNLWFKSWVTKRWIHDVWDWHKLKEQIFATGMHLCQSLLSSNAVYHLGQHHQPYSTEHSHQSTIRLPSQPQSFDQRRQNSPWYWKCTSLQSAWSIPAFNICRCMMLSKVRELTGRSWAWSKENRSKETEVETLECRQQEQNPTSILQFCLWKNCTYHR